MGPVPEGLPKPDEVLVRRGRTHPCVNLSPEAVARARRRCDTEAWAAGLRDRALEAAAPWLAEADAYWLAFLPAPGACYAYGLAGCPRTGERMGQWASANCAWDRPGTVANSAGVVYPNADYPDDGEGWHAPDGRTFYFVGTWNAWVTEQWTTRAIPALADAYLLTGDGCYADRCALLLDALASIFPQSTSGSRDYPSNPPSGRLARPWYQVARILVKYVDAYDAVFNDPALERETLGGGMTRRERIERDLILDAAYYCYSHSFHGALHNGHADYVRGALAAGCLLDIPEYVRVALDTPHAIHAMLANNIDRDGLYYETSPLYSFHTVELYLTFAEPLWHLRSAEHPAGVDLYNHPLMRALLTLPGTRLRLAGRRPNFGDDAPQTDYVDPRQTRPDPLDLRCLERLMARADDDTARRSARAALESLTGRSLAEARADAPDRWALFHGLDADEAPSAPEGEPCARVRDSWVAGVKGLALLRGGDDMAALLRFGPALNHADYDDLGLVLYANGYQLTYDLGYVMGNTHAHVGWAAQTVSHALVTVNETSQLGGDGSGGSLRFFAGIGGLRAVEADSPLSYAEEGVTAYRRTAALVHDAGYFVDFFHAAGGRRHDYGFGSIGTDLEPFGVHGLEARAGSLAEGVAWGEQVGNDGDIAGQPNRPYWNPPPGNGYGFLRNVRVGAADPVWGGTWRIPGKPGATVRMHLAGDPAEAVFADGPGIDPTRPPVSFVLARRTGDALESRFLAVYEPFDAGAPRIVRAERLGVEAIAVYRAEGAVDVLVRGDHAVDTPLGALAFQGRYARLTGRDGALVRAEFVGCDRCALEGTVLHDGPGAFEATVSAVDPKARRVALDAAPPQAVAGLVAVFSNDAWTRTSACHVRAVDGDALLLDAATLVLGCGRVAAVEGDTLHTDVPHEYIRSLNRARKRSTRFFDGKVVAGERGVTARITAAQPLNPMRVTLNDASGFREGDTFTYHELWPGDRVRIDLPARTGA